MSKWFYHMILNIYTEENNRLHPGSEQDFTTIADKICLLMPYTVLSSFQNINQIKILKSIIFSHSYSYFSYLYIIQQITKLIQI